MMELKRIDWKSTAKLFGVLYAVIGAIVGVMYAGIFGIIGIIGLLAANDTTTAIIGLIIGAVIAIIVLIIAIIFYSIIGAIAGAIMALVYNFAAGRVGGIKLDLVGAK